MGSNGGTLSGISFRRGSARIRMWSLCLDRDIVLKQKDFFARPQCLTYAHNHSSFLHKRTGWNENQLAQKQPAESCVVSIELRKTYKNVRTKIASSVK